MRPFFLLITFFCALQVGFAQILNNEINMEVRIAEYYGASDNDGTSTDEQSMLITTDYSDSFASSQLTSCSVFDCHAPCSANEDVTAGPFYYTWLRGRAMDLTLDFKLHAWGDEDNPECTFNLGDQDEFIGWASDYLLSNPVVVNNRAPGKWHADLGSNAGWLFPNSSMYNIKPKVIWRYHAGADCSTPLDFGTINEGETKRHVNANRSESGFVFGDAPVDYDHILQDFHPSPEVYYAFTIEEHGLVTISTGNPDTNFDTFLGLMEEGCGQALTWNDDEDFAVLSSKIEVSLDAGRYIVFVEGYNFDQGDFELSITVESTVTTTEVKPGMDVIIGPNPSEGQVKVSFTDPLSYQDARLEVIDLSGQVVFKSSITALSSMVDLSELSAGAYVIRLRSAIGQINKKIILL